LTEHGARALPPSYRAYDGVNGGKSSFLYTMERISKNPGKKYLVRNETSLEIGNILETCDVSVLGIHRMYPH
jgi:hypothetical protein